MHLFIFWLLGFASCVGLCIYLALYYKIPEEDPSQDLKSNK
jgi:hypothetical protein